MDAIVRTHDDKVQMIEDRNCTSRIPPRRHRYDGITSCKKRYKPRNLIECCFNKLEHFRPLDRA